MVRKWVLGNLAETKVHQTLSFLSFISNFQVNQMISRATRLRLCKSVQQHSSVLCGLWGVSNNCPCYFYIAALLARVANADTEVQVLNISASRRTKEVRLR
jgi:hypothetical protein